MGEAEVRVLDLPKLIEIKEITNRDKDRAMLPFLRQALELQETPLALGCDKGREG